MGEIQQLIAERDALDARIKEAVNRGKADALRQVKSLATEFGLTAVELQRCAGTNGKPALPVRFRDPATGQGWSGVGKHPIWIREAIAAGRKKEEFSVDAARPAPAKKAAAPAKTKKKAPQGRLSGKGRVG